MIFAEGYRTGYSAGFAAALEAAALSACPVPHLEEERECEEVAAAIRALPETPPSRTEIQRLDREITTRSRAVWEVNLARVWNEALELAVRIVYPNSDPDDQGPENDTERESAEVAKAILRRKKHLRPRAVEKLYARQYELIDKKNHTADEEAEYLSIRKKVSNLPTARDPEEQLAHDFVIRAAELCQAHKL
jgi:hypothetical protein